MASSEHNPVVLIHGWGGSFRDTWQKPGIDALLEDVGRHVIGLDLLGHGNQPKPHEPEAYADLPQWLLEELPSTTGPIDVVAFSLGALTVLRALCIAPERFGRVILAGIGDGVFEVSKSDANKRIVDALEGRSEDDDAFAHMFVHYANQPNNDVVALTAIMKRPPSPPMTVADLEKVSNQVLVVIGDKDFTWPAERLASSFPNGRLSVLRNTDHFATTDSFAFIDQIIDFMA